MRRPRGFLRITITLLILPVLAAAGPSPDSSVLARFRDGRWNRFRVVTAQSQYLLTTLDADAEGIELGRAGRPGRLAAPDPALHGTTRVAWPDVRRVDGGRTGFSVGRFGKGLLLGTLAGAAVVGLYYAIDTGASIEQAGVFLAVPLGTIAGGIAGASFRSPSRWHELYP